jgi:hypothetical protein
VSPENGELESRLTFGVRFVSWLMSCTPFARNVSVVKAVIAMGTSWMSCARFVAVTMISSSTCWADADPHASASATALPISDVTRTCGLPAFASAAPGRPAQTVARYPESRCRRPCRRD